MTRRTGGRLYAVHVAEGSVIVYRPVTHLWNHLAAADNLPAIFPGVHSVITDEPAMRKGSTREGRAAFMGIDVRWSSRIVEIDEPKFIAARATLSAPTGSTADAECELTLEPVAEGTLLSVNLRTESALYEFFEQVTEEVAIIAYTRSLQANLMNLADWLDAGRRRNLTPRHREVLRMIQQGLTDREIAEKLYISPKTVGHHVSAILAAFRVTQRQDLRRSFEFPEQ